MKKISIKKITLGVLSVFTAGLIATAGVAYAYQGNPDDQGPNYDSNLHDLKVDAFDTGDYDTWKDLMEQAGNQGRVMDMVNEDNFNTFVEAHNAAMNGDVELANQLRAEMGLNNGRGAHDGTGYKQGGQGQHKGRGMGNGQGNHGATQGQNSQGNFVDVDGDGTCDTAGTSQGRMKGR